MERGVRTCDSTLRRDAVSPNTLGLMSRIGPWMGRGVGDRQETTCSLSEPCARFRKRGRLSPQQITHSLATSHTTVLVLCVEFLELSSQTRLECLIYTMQIVKGTSFHLVTSTGSSEGTRRMWQPGSTHTSPAWTILSVLVLLRLPADVGAVEFNDEYARERVTKTRFDAVSSTSRVAGRIDAYVFDRDHSLSVLVHPLLRTVRCRGV